MSARLVVVAGNLRLPGPRVKSCSGITDVAEVFLAFGFERGVETGGGCFCHDSG